MSNENLQKQFLEDAPQAVDNLSNVQDLSDCVIRLQKIEDEIKQSIINYEPRVDLTSINVSPNYETGVFDTVITYLIVGADVPTQQLSFALLPTR